MSNFHHLTLSKTVWEFHWMFYIGENYFETDSLVSDCNLQLLICVTLLSLG